MTAKSKDPSINVSSVKSIDITTKEKNEIKLKPEKKPEIIKPTGMIKDIHDNPDQENKEIIGSPKLDLPENLISNLKPPSENRKVIKPTPAVNESDLVSKPADDLTGDDKTRDKSYIDKISAEDSHNTEEKDSSIDESMEEKDVTNKADQDDDKISDTEKSDPKKSDDEQSDKYDNDGIVNELAEQAADTKKKKQEDKELDDRAQRIEELIEAKTYNVPIAQLSHKRHTRLLMIILVMLLVCGLIAVNIAIDAGTIDIGIEPLTDFIPN